MFTSIHSYAFSFALGVLCIFISPTCAMAQSGFISLRATDYPVNAKELPVYYKQFDLGELNLQECIEVKIEYPEYKELTAKEIKELATSHTTFQPDSIPRLKWQTATARKRTIVDVQLTPIVRKRKKWYRLVSCKLSVNNDTTKMPPVQRIGAKIVSHAKIAKRYAEKSVLSEGRWVKISVTKEGVYALTPSQLASMGFNDPTRVKLYGYGGRLLPETFTFEGRDALIDDLCEVPLYREDGRLLFFAEGTTRLDWTASAGWVQRQNTFSTRSCYFLTEGETPAAFQATEAAPGEKVISSISAVSYVDNDAMNWFGGGRVLYDKTDLSTGGQKVQINLTGKVPNSNVRVAWDASAAGALQPTNVRLELIGAEEGNATISSIQIQTYNSSTESARGMRTQFTSDKFVAGINTLNVATNSSNPSRLNYVRVNFEQTLSAAHTKGSFSPRQQGTATLHIEGATPDLRLWQLADGAGSVCELKGSIEGTVLSVPVTDASARFVLVDLSASYPAPTVEGEVKQQNLHGIEKADYIIIIPASGKLAAEASRLATIHFEKQGLVSQIVTTEQIYNEFSSGTPDATAIRRFVKMLYDRATNEAEAPKYLLLMGDVAWDNRMITSDWRGVSPDDFLPAFELSDQDNSTTSYSIGTLHSYITDDYYGFLDDNEGASLTTAKLDIGIGRLPCHTPEMARIMIDRIERYLNNEHAGNWRTAMYVIGDSGDNNLHMKDSEAVSTQVATSAGESLRLSKIYPAYYAPATTGTSTTYPDATRRLKNAMQRGALIFNYNGHGAPERLSHQKILMLDDMKANKSTAAPLWIMASCEIAPFDNLTDNLGQAALYNEEGGAIAVMCATRSVYANYNRSLNMSFIEQLFTRNDKGSRPGMGEALRLAKVDLLTPGSGTYEAIKDGTMNKLKYVLLGDPAVPLAFPTTSIVVDSINGKPIGTSMHTLQAASVVTISGHIGQADYPSKIDTTFNGTVTASVFDRQQTLTCQDQPEQEDPLKFKEFTKRLFEGNVKVNKGCFKLKFGVPRDISYTNERGLLSLYAITEKGDREAVGNTRQFCLNGTDASAEVDSVAPKLYVYLNTPDFPNGGLVGNDAIFYAVVADSAGISTTGLGMGHDIELVIDENYAEPIVLNEYFNYDYGTYNKGIVTYPLTGLTPEGTNWNAVSGM